MHFIISYRVDRDTWRLLCPQTRPSQLVFCRLTSNSDRISLAIKIVEDFSWSLQLHGRSIEPHACSIPCLTAEDWAKCVCLVMDEMYVKEDLVYNKHSGELVGFANLGETNEQLWMRVKTHLSPRENDPKNLDVESQCMYNHFTYASCNIHLQG